MSDILDASGHKMATIGQDGVVYNLAHVRLGHVDDIGNVYDDKAVKVGNYDGSGFVYEAGRHIGTIHSDGTVYNYENHCVGKVMGDHLESGGAALLLLVR